MRHFSEESEIVLNSNDPICPVGYLRLKKLSLEVKLPNLDLQRRLSGLPLKDSDGYITDYGVEASDFSDDDDKSVKSIEDGCVSSETLEQEARPVKSADGWLWISGIQGRAPDFREAMQEATRTLKCRYATDVIVFTVLRGGFTHTESSPCNGL